MTLTPAYGRDYKSKKGVLKDWDENKDFVINDVYESATYINKRDAVKAGIREVNFRYKKLTMVFVHKLA
jgi:hypothetical protein